MTFYVSYSGILSNTRVDKHRTAKNYIDSVLRLYVGVNREESVQLTVEDSVVGQL